MAKKTTGTLYTSGEKKFFYLRYKHSGKDTRMRLLDPAGKPITKESEAKAAANRVLNRINETNKAEQLRTLKNDIQDAEAAAIDAAAELLNSKATISGGWTLFMSCPKRPSSCKRFTLDTIPRHTTAANYRSYYERFSAWMKEKYTDALLMSDITQDIAAAFMDSLRSSAASGTFNKYLQFFNCFFDTLSTAGKIKAVNPFKSIERETHRYNSKKPLSLEQIALLIDRAEDDMKLLVALGYFTGLRLGDCCTLQWSEIDLIRGVIERIPRKIENTVKDLVEARIKVGIPQFLQSLLSAIPADHRKGYVLPNFAELYLQSRDQLITKRILKHFELCGINIHRAGTGIKTTIDSKTGAIKKEGCRAVVEIGFHSLRYSYISHNAEAGTPAAIIQKNAGHANPAMTEHYTRISDNAAVKYAAALQLPSADTNRIVEPERIELHRLIDTLSPEQIREILNNVRRT